MKEGPGQQLPRPFPYSPPEALGPVPLHAQVACDNMPPGSGIIPGKRANVLPDLVASPRQRASFDRGWNQ